MLATPLRKFGYHYYLIEKLNKDTVSDEFYEVFSVLKNFSEIYALKLFRKGYPDEFIQKEIEIYEYLNKEESPYFLKCISNSKDELIVKEKYIVLEFPEKGMLKNYILLGVYFSEQMAKILTWKIFQCYIRLHEIGIMHKKISLEYIFLDKFYNLKIGNFEYAKIIRNIEKDEKSYENEFREEVYNLAILIIQLLTGKLELKMIKDSLKLVIKKKNFGSFWKIIETQSENGEYDFTAELKDLINIMLSGKTVDIKKLLSHDWFEKVRTSVANNEFDLYEQYMKNELKKLEEGKNMA